MNSIEIPLGEYAPDRGEYDLQNNLRRADNVIPVAGAYAVRNDFNSSGLTFAALDDEPLAAASFKGVNFVADRGDLYTFTASASDWSQAKVSKSGGYGARNFCDFALFGNRVIACYPGAAPQYYDMGSSSLFADLPGSPPTAGTAAVVRDFLVLGGLGGASSKVQWSGFNNSEEWGESLSTQASSQEIPDAREVLKIVGGQVGYIFTDTALWRMTYVGPPTVFKFDQILKNEGIYSAASVVEVDGAIYYHSRAGFKRFNGQTSEPIGSDRVDRLVEESLGGSARIDRVAAGVDRRRGLVIWSYGSTYGGPNQIVYSYRTGRWAKWGSTLVSCISEASGWNGPETVFWNSDTKKIMPYTSGFATPNVRTGYFRPNPDGLFMASEVEVVASGSQPSFVNQTAAVRANLFTDSDTTPADELSDEHGIVTRAAGKFFSVQITGAGYETIEGIRIRGRAAGRR